MATTTVEDVLERLSPEGVQRMKQEMLEDVLDAVAEQARADAPKLRGFSSRKSLVSRIKPVVIRTGEWGVVRSGAPHSHLIEFGVKPHSLVAGSGKRKKRKGKSGVMKIYGDPDILRRGAWHPGFAGRPFLGTAVEGADDEIEVIMENSGETLFSDVRYWKRRTKRQRK